MDPEELKHKLADIDLKVIVDPIMNVLCRNTTGIDEFALELLSTGVITSDQFNECKNEKTELNRNIFLYTVVKKKPVGDKLIAALLISGNDHMVKQISKSYIQVSNNIPKKSYINRAYGSDTTLQKSNLSCNSSAELLPSRKSIISCPEVDENQNVFANGPGPSSPIRKISKASSSLTLESDIIFNNVLPKPVKTLCLNNCTFKLSQLHKLLAQCQFSLKCLEFNHFTITPTSIPSLSLTPLKLPNLKSLVIKIALPNRESDPKQLDRTNLYNSKKLLKSLLSVIDSRGISKNRLNTLYNLTHFINNVDISIGGSRFLYFNKETGELVVKRLPYLDPNMYLTSFKESLNKFACAENSMTPLILENLNHPNLTELNLYLPKFNFNSPNVFHKWLLSLYKLSKVTICLSNESSDAEDFKNFDLEYIARASSLKKLTLGNFCIKTSARFNDIWNRFTGETLTFHNCSFEGLNLHEGMDEENQTLLREVQFKELIQIQKIDVSVGTENKGNLWYQIRNESNNWILYYQNPVSSYTQEFQKGIAERYEQIYFDCFQLGDFSDFQSRLV